MHATYATESKPSGRNVSVAIETVSTIKIRVRLRRSEYANPFQSGVVIDLLKLSSAVQVVTVATRHCVRR